MSLKNPKSGKNMDINVKASVKPSPILQKNCITVYMRDSSTRDGI